MAKHIVIYDAVSWSTGSARDNDLEYHTLTRGDEVPSDVPADAIKRWKNADTHPPFGAIAKQGSRLADMLRSPVSLAADPAEQHARLTAAAGQEATRLDPAAENADEEKTGVDGMVEQSRRLAARSAAEAQARTGADSGATGEQLEDMSKSDLQDMADGLGVEHARSDTKADLVEKIRAAQGGTAPADAGDSSSQE